MSVGPSYKSIDLSDSSMDLSTTQLSVFLNIVAAFLMVFAVWLFVSFKQAGNRKYALFLISISLYVGGYGIELLQQDIKHMLWMTHVEYIGICFIPGYWLLFVCEFLGFTKLARRLSLPLVLIASLLLTIKLTDQWHQLFYDNVEAIDYHGSSVLRIEHGVFYWIFQIYAYSCFFTSLYLLIKNHWHLPGHFKKQIKFMVFALFVAITPDVLFFLNWIQTPIDLSPFALSISAAIVFYAFIVLRTGTTVPIARNYVVEHLPFGIITVDTELRILDCNQYARDELQLNIGTVGQTLSSFRDLEFIQKPELIKEDRLKLIHEKWFEFSMSPVSEKKNTTCGYVVTFKDVSAQKRFIDSLERSLSEQHQEFEKTKSSLLEVSEQERLKIGNDLHSSLCQDLSSLVLMGKTMLRGQHPNAAVGELKDTFNQFINEAISVNEMARNFSHCLAVNEVENELLEEELYAFSHSIQQLYKVNCELTYSSRISSLSDNEGTLIYRIIREAVFNALRHGAPKWIYIDLLEKNGHLLVNIINEGGNAIADDFSSIKKGLGLNQISNYAKALNAALLIIPNDNKDGTLVKLTIPKESACNG